MSPGEYTMSTATKTYTRTALLLALGSLLPLTSASALDWSGVPAKDVLLTYPGQTSWEWVLTPADHEGAQKFRGGKDCRSCHDNEALTEGGNEVAKGGKLEPSPIAGKPGTLPIKVQVAHDDSKLYFRLQWKDTGTKAGQDQKYAARATVFIANPALKEAQRGGCWAACHDDSKGMPSAGAAPQDKYLGASRVKLSRQGGGANIKPAADLTAALAAGTYAEYWSAGLNPSQPAVAVNGYILDKRNDASPTSVSAEASFNGGEWTVVIARPLAGTGSGQNSFAAGQVYPIGFAIHDGQTQGRFHYVSMEHKLTLDSGSADFVAGKR